MNTKKWWIEIKKTKKYWLGDMLIDLIHHTKSP